MSATTTQDKTIPQPSALVHVAPILQWLPRYNRSWFSIDVVAGLTLWGLALPEALAYAIAKSLFVCMLAPLSTGQLAPPVRSFYRVVGNTSRRS
jgi:hypothetical protein